MQTLETGPGSFTGTGEPSASTPTPMYRLIPEGSRGDVKIEHFVVSPEDSQLTMIRAFQHREAFVPAGTYVGLRIHGKLYMSDTRAEWKSNRDIIQKAKGDVLIAGLGIGMILRDILPKPEVTSVTVVENNSDLVALLEPVIANWPHGEKLDIICADIFSYEPCDGQMFDTIYFDIWAEQDENTPKEFTALHRKGRKWRKPGGWMACWRVNQRPIVAR